MIEKLAKVESAGLSFTDRSILIANITVEYEEGLHQNIANLILDDPAPKDTILPEHVVGDRSLRLGTAQGCEFIRRTLEVFNIDDLHQLKGAYLWVIGEGEGLSYRPIGFRPLSVDKKARKGTVIYKDIFNKQ